MITSIAKMSQNGTPSSFINFQPTNSCVVTSSSSLTTGSEYLQANFSYNPAKTSLYVVTVNMNEVWTWDPSKGSASCDNGVPYCTNGFNYPTTV
jgi:hypothetical protein